MAAIGDCCLCSQIEGIAENDLIARLLPGEPYVRRVMLESRHFAAIPSLGPLVPGHSLLCPKSHVRSFAELDLALEGEYSRVKEELAETLRRCYGGEVHSFEHGNATDGSRTLCSVEHAHLHLLPMPRGFVIETGGWLELDGSLGSLKRHAAGREYIVYQAPGSAVRFAAGGDFQSQLMRKVIADALGHDQEWNWRSVPNARAADQAWQRVATARS